MASRAFDGVAASRGVSRLTSAGLDLVLFRNAFVASRPVSRIAALSFAAVAGSSVMPR
jgi:hypothetical protein